MTTQTRAQQLKEIEFQTQMLNNLKNGFAISLFYLLSESYLRIGDYVPKVNAIYSIWCSWSDHYDHQCDTLCCHRTWY